MTLKRLSKGSPTNQYQSPVGSPRDLRDTEWTYHWFGHPWYIRTTKAEDLRDDEDLQQEKDHPSDDLERFTCMETVFYESFIRTRITNDSKGKAVEVASDFENFKVGDTVLVDFDNRANPSVGVIVALWHTRMVHGFPHGGRNHENMKIRVHWFVRPEQTAQICVERHHLMNEVYYSVDEDAVVAPADVVSHCAVISTHPEPEVLPLVSKSPIQGSSSQHENFDRGLDTLSQWHVSAILSCKFALDARQGFYYDFDWEHHHAMAISEGPQENGLLWDVELGEEKQLRTRKVISMDTAKSDHGTDICSQADDEFGQYSDLDTDITTEDEDISTAHFEVGESASSKRKEPHLSSGDVSPLKRRKLSSLSPNSTDAFGACSEAIRESSGSSNGVSLDPPRATESCAQLCNLPQDLDPYLRVMHVLTLEHHPDTFTCREAEYIEIMTTIMCLIDVGIGGCIYMTGDPGTGKTTTVYEVVDELKDLAGRNECNPFTYLEINGSKIPEPSVAYSMLWEVISGRNTVTDGNFEISPGDALEMLNYHFSAEMASGPGSHACVVVLDNLDQLVTPTQDVIYHFLIWSSLPWSTLIVVAVSNIFDMPERVLSPEVRRRLDVRRVRFSPYRVDQLREIVQARVDIAKESSGDEATINAFNTDALKYLALNGSGNARNMLDLCRGSVELIRSTGDEAVDFVHVLQVLNVKPKSPAITALGGYSPHQRIMLASLLRCLKRERADSVRWEIVRRQYRINMDLWLGGEDPELREGEFELSSVLSSLVDDGVIRSWVESDSQKALALQIDAGEVESMLLEQGGEFWKRLLGD